MGQSLLKFAEDDSLICGSQKVLVSSAHYRKTASCKEGIKSIDYLQGPLLIQLFRLLVAVGFWRLRRN